MKRIIIPIALAWAPLHSSAQLLLEADGPGNTYELITSKLAPGYNPIEVPDCGHTSFGRHIDEIFDTELNKNVFQFHIHQLSDDDRCINFDRQRNEIKTYNQSPDSLLAVEGETIEYKWKFKIDAGFQSSPKFTHLHQLKAVGGSEAGMPLITLTTREGNPDEMELRYARTTSQVTLKEVDLAPFKGVWCEATERVLFGENGTYSLTIAKVSDNTTLFSYSNDDIRMWKTQADFIRPKWGIYRSLEFVDKLRDEQVLFADFSIEENPKPKFSKTTAITSERKVLIAPNPTHEAIGILGIDSDCFFEFFDSAGKKVLVGNTSNFKINLTDLPKAVYFIHLHTEEGIIIKKVVKK